MSSSAGIRSNATAPAQAMSSTERNIEAIKRFSRVFLGHGYDRVTKSADKVLELVVEAFSEEDIEVRDYKTFSAIAIDSTHEQAMQAVQNRIQVDVQLPSFNTGVKANFETKREERTERSHLVCACVCLDIARSAFRRTPPLRADLKPWEARVGDSVIKSGYSFTGYQISLQVDIEKETNERERKIGGGLAGIPWLQGLIKIGLDGDSIKKKLQGRTITRVIITEVIGFGSYRPPIKACLSVSDFGEIQEAIEVINNDFVTRLPEIHRRYHIDPKNDLIPFSRLAPKDNPREVPSTPFFDALKETSKMLENRPLSLYPTEDLFGNLNDKIRGGRSIGMSTSVILDGLDLTAFLSAIEMVFNPTFASKRNLQPADEYCLVAGKTGVGKSTFIGYMLRNTLQLKLHEDGETVLDYESDFSDDLAYPAIGHGTSRTKGFRVFFSRAMIHRHEHRHQEREVIKGYIDTAGFFDISGREARICNAMALKMAIQDFCPKRLIVVLESSVFDNRASGFFELIANVKEILKNPKSKGTWPFILFLINDHRLILDPRTKQPIDEDNIINKIKKAQNVLIEERNRLLPQEDRSILSRAKAWIPLRFGGDSEDKKTFEEQLHKLDEKTLRRITELQEKIDFLEGFSKSNIIVGNLTEPSTRDRVLEWQGHDSRSGLARNLFSLESLGGKEYTEFHTVLTLVASHFNNICINKQKLINQLCKLMNDEHELELEKRSLEKTPGGEEFAELKQKSEEKLAKRRKERHRLKKLEKKEQRKLRELKLDKVEPYNPIFSTTPIQPRSFFSLIDAWAKKYEFSYSGPPLEKIEFIEPTKKAKSPGGFLKIEDGEINTGKFKAMYRPAWHGYDKDADAKVLTWIKNRNRPAVEELRSLSEAELGDEKSDKMDTTSLRAQLKAIEGRIKGLKANIIEYEKGSLEGMEGKEAANKRIREIEKQLEASASMKKGLLDEFDNIRAELCAYEGFCQLISQIIIELGLNLSDNKSEKIIFQKFVNNFDNREKINAYVPSSNASEEIGTNYFGLEPASGYFEVGNCLFEAVSIYSPNSSAAVLREETIKWIGKNEELQDSIKAGIGKEKLQILDAKIVVEEDQFVEVTYSSTDDYLQKMRQNKTWGTGVECRALAQLLGQPIYILTKDNQFDQVFEKQLPGEPIFLEYDGSHYRALTCDIGKEKEIAKVILRQINKK